MKTTRIPVLVLAACALGAPAGAVLAQTYPAKPIRFLVPFAPGGGADTMARLVGTPLTERMGQQVVIENRGGAGGTIGAALGAKAPPDGYTIVMGSTNLAAAPSLHGKLPFDPLKDFTAVTLLARTPSVMAVHPSLPVKSVKELVALARARPGQINYAGGVGSTNHLDAELFKSMAKVDIVQVPYNGTGPSLIGVVSGEASVIIAPALVVLPQVKSGRLRALAVTSAQRSRATPELPTVAESGVPGFETAQWYGIVVPAGVPDTIVARLNAEAVKVVNDPDLAARMARDGTLPAGTTPQEFAAFFRSEVAKWAKVIKTSGAKAE
ncbi:MAG TPA: tripartite tricarboxylate transporter substrate binding protein [Burkholderiales bacterium]|jgi:tripartite-type tricarboxylate transporter receptor subunit TctC|nr:tripartite tricarboxylate transporter substrate binding protein [Burkholderiales bacterium]